MRRVLKWMTVPAGAASVAFALFLAVGLSRPLDPIPQFGSRPQTVVINAITIIDVLHGAELPYRTVEIEDGRISRITNAGEGGVGAGAVVIDGRGKYLIPGLWDSHVHTLALSDRLHFPLLLANGVTSIRNMGDGCSWGGKMDCIPDRDQWQPSSRAPTVVATAGYHIEQLASPSEASALVTALKARGDDIIKIQLDGESDPDSSKFKAIVKAAGDIGVPVSGHVPPGADLSDDVFAALTSIEHDSHLAPHCPADAPATCDHLLAVLASRRTAYVPTHGASSGQDVALSQEHPSQDSLLPYTHSALAMIWKAYRFMHRLGTSEGDLAELKRKHADALSLTLRAHRAGVPVLAGTDALDPFVLHGVSLHEELAYLSRAGLSPAEVLRAATTSPARMMKEESQVGQVEVGQRADLVLLASNPLNDIKSTQDIHTVIAKGVVYAPADREMMRAFVEQQAGSLAVNARAWWALLGFDAH